VSGGIGSFCSGVGGLDLAVETVTGLSTVWQAEIERLRDLGLELLGAGRGLYDAVTGGDPNPGPALRRWDAVDARCTGEVTGDVHDR
jgi:hypothetical protein